MHLSVASYNILAHAYVKLSYYPHSDPAVFNIEQRQEAVVNRITALKADVVCLQEVDESMCKVLSVKLSDYEIHMARRMEGRPDGCATLVHKRFPLRFVDICHYPDKTGHLALIVVFEVEGFVLGIANTHARWDAPHTKPENQLGTRQIQYLLDRLEKISPPCQGVILCGDLNAEPNSLLIQSALARGMQDAYAGLSADTCNSNRRAKRIDYLLYTPNLTCKPLLLSSIDGDTPLPSATEPSDHLPILGVFHL